MQTYLFYDIETTGLNKCFDQVLQFAAIRTNLQFKELERHEIRIKLNKDVIPAPGAIITHRIGIDMMLSGENEDAATKKIHRMLNKPGTISVGYNTLGFDDEFLRFSFYRNLLPPYTHQFANQCKRMDIYPITVMYYLFKPEALEWPMIDGQVSLKLDNINALNQLAKGQAHDAMVDVEATLALAKKLAQHQEMWAYACGYFNKPEDLHRMQMLPYSLKLTDSQHQEALLVNGKLGKNNYFQAPVISLGQHRHYKNQTLWLRLDQEDLQKTNDNNIADNTFVIKKRAAEQQLLLPPKDRFLKYLTPERKELTDKNRQWLQENPDLLKKICHYHQDYKYPPIVNLDTFAALYDSGFPPAAEEKHYRDFHQADPKDKESIALQFADPIRRELAMRLLARHYPDQLSDKNKQEYQTYLTQINDAKEAPVDYRNETIRTKTCAIDEIAKLEASPLLDTEQKALLDELSRYLNHL